MNYRDRAKLYERIDKRVDLMLDNGLLKEAETYLGNMGSTAVQAIGYKELKPYLSGEAELSQCVENLKRATRFAEIKISIGFIPMSMIQEIKC